MQNELRMKSRALNESITNSHVRASGDAELISDLQGRLRDSELQCHSLQSVIHERKNEKKPQQKTRYFKVSNVLSRN